MSEELTRYNEGHLPAGVRAARDNVVKRLRELADQIDRANLDRLTDGLAWVVGGVEVLARVVDRALGRR